MGHKAQLTRAAGTVGGLTLISRILGLVRDVVLAGLLGAGPVSDAFFVAFRIPNLLRRMFAEGAFSVAFVPVFSEHVETAPHEKTLALYRRTATLLGIAMIIVTALGIIFSPAVVKVISPGFDKNTFQLATSLTRFMFPYIFLITMVSLAGGVLNSTGKFAAPALAPALLNVAIVFFALAVTPLFPEKRPYVLAAGVLAGGVLQWLCLVPGLKNSGFTFKFKFEPSDPAIRRIVKNMGPALLSAAVYQVNVLVVTNLASFLSKGSITYLYYSDRIVQFPLGLFAVAMGTAILPALSKSAAKEEIHGFKDTLLFGLRLIMFFSIPASVAMISLRIPILSTLFQHGRFTHTDTLLTAKALFCASLGLPGVGALILVSRAFYALGDTKTPFKTALAAMVLNVGLSLWLMNTPLKHAGLALAPALASTANAAMLFVLLRRKIGSINITQVAWCTLRSLALAAAMALTMNVLLKFAPNDVFLNAHTMHRAGWLCALVILGFVFYMACSALFKFPEWKELKSAVGRRDG